MTSTEFKKRFLPLYKELYQVAIRILGESCEAQDALQNLFLKLWERRTSLDDVKNDRAYSRQLLKNICIDRWREIEQYKQENIDNYTDNTADNACNEDELNDKRKFLTTFIKHLHKRHKQIFTLRLRGCTYSEIEKLTGEPAANLRMTVSRLKKELINSYKQKNNR